MKNADAVVDIRGLTKPDDEAEWVTSLWTKWDNQRQPIKSHWSEVDSFLFSVDTSTTANSSLPWTHSARNPKLTNIRDNLHSNYISALFPNDKWLNWVAYSKEDATREKAEIILAYMDNKTREGGFRNTVSSLLYDYIDRGVAFAMPAFENRYHQKDHELVTEFVGPTAVRINPNDIVFNPTVDNFRNTPKIVRTITTVGQIRKMVETHPEQKFWLDYLEKRAKLTTAARTYQQEDWEKSVQYSIDGFGNLQEYYISDTVEILEFYGDYYDSIKGELTTNRMITVADRSTLVRNEEIHTYTGRDPISMVGWRKRPNNLWSQGPLDLIMGLQYQLDHYTNMTANALDLKVMPPVKIYGNVEEFFWGPGEKIHIDEDGEVTEMNVQTSELSAAIAYITEIENRMELYAGAPREAMGVRTPGEKTAFEVQALENAAGRIFQEKITQFEVFMEELLNNMLEEAHRNFNTADVIRITDKSLGVVEFRDITKDDITANGVLRPVGARVYAQKAQDLQNLVGVLSSPIGEMILPHTSSIELSKYIENVTDVRGYEIFKPNVAVSEQQDTKNLMNDMEEEQIAKDQIIPENFSGPQEVINQ